MILIYLHWFMNNTIIFKKVGWWIRVKYVRLVRYMVMNIWGMMLKMSMIVIDRHSDMGRVALLRRHLYNFHNPLLGLISTTRLFAVATTQIYFYLYYYLYYFYPLLLLLSFYIQGLSHVYIYTYRHTLSLHDALPIYITCLSLTLFLKYS